MALTVLQAAKQAIDEISAIQQAFGAPGDYGYETREGKALFSLYRFREELKAALACASDIQWRPIETAPKDDSRILVFRPAASGLPALIGLDYWRLNSWWCSRGDQQPTHWTPLPSSPTLTEAAA